MTSALQIATLVTPARKATHARAAQTVEVGSEPGSTPGTKDSGSDKAAAADFTDPIPPALVLTIMTVRHR